MTHIRARVFIGEQNVLSCQPIENRVTKERVETVFTRRQKHVAA